MTLVFQIILFAVSVALLSTNPSDPILIGVCAVTTVTMIVAIIREGKS